MPTTMAAAEDAILGQVQTPWAADTPAIVSGDAPKIVYEATERDLKTHPKDSTLPWARMAIRHTTAVKATLASANKSARYRRNGTLFMQIYTPGKDAPARTMCQSLAVVAQKAYEGKRSADGSVVFTSASIQERNPDGPWFDYLLKVTFYWDEIK